MGMMCGKNRTINFYSAFFDYFKCPRFTFPNRKAWRSKVFNRFSGYILKQFYRRTYIFLKWPDPVARPIGDSSYGYRFHIVQQYV